MDPLHPHWLRLWVEADMDEMLLLKDQTTLGHVSHRIQDLQEGGSHWCSSGGAAHSHSPSWASALQEQDGPGALGCALSLGVSSKVPGHFVDHRKPDSLLQLLPPGKNILISHWLHQLFEPLCLLTKSLQRNQCPWGVFTAGKDFTLPLWLTVETTRGQAMLGRQSAAGCTLPLLMWLLPVLVGNSTPGLGD